MLPRLNSLVGRLTESFIMGTQLHTWGAGAGGSNSTRAGVSVQAVSDQCCTGEQCCQVNVQALTHCSCSVDFVASLTLQKPSHKWLILTVSQGCWVSLACQTRPISRSPGPTISGNTGSPSMQHLCSLLQTAAVSSHLPTGHLW